jgi:hypothetical protein
VCICSSTLRKCNPNIPSSISAVPPFPGLRRFPDGRDFMQWTGDDSKALMKVTVLPFPLFFIIMNTNLTIVYTYRFIFVQLLDMSLQIWSNASLHSLTSATLYVEMLYLRRTLMILKIDLHNFITTMTSSSKQGFASTSPSRANIPSSITFVQSASTVRQMDCARQSRNLSTLRLSRSPGAVRVDITH